MENQEFSLRKPTPEERNEFSGMAGTAYIVETPEDYPLNHPKEVTETLGDNFRLTLIIDMMGVSFNYVSENGEVFTATNDDYTKTIREALSEHLDKDKTILELGLKFFEIELPFLENLGELESLGFKVGLE